MAIATDSGTKPRRQCDITREANARARKARVCERCGVDFVQSDLSSKQKAAGHRQRFCSNACRAMASRVYADRQEAKQAQRDRARERAGLLPRAGVRSCEECSTEFDAKSVAHVVCSDGCRVRRALRVEQEQHQPVTFNCRQCGSLHTAAYGDKSRTFCGFTCRKRAAKDANVRSGQRAAQRKARKLRKRGVTVEPVNDLSVLRRDKWTCQLCGVKTPERLRGSFDDRAPEVDHIVTLADGGEHSYRNVQCACRRCNLSKGSASKGQLRLFG